MLLCLYIFVIKDDINEIIINKILYVNLEKAPIVVQMSVKYIYYNIHFVNNYKNCDKKLYNRKRKATTLKETIRITSQKIKRFLYKIYFKNSIHPCKQIYKKLKTHI